MSDSNPITKERVQRVAAATAANLAFEAFIERKQVGTKQIMKEGVLAAAYEYFGKDVWAPAQKMADDGNINPLAGKAVDEGLFYLGASRVYDLAMTGRMAPFTMREFLTRTGAAAVAVLGEDMIAKMAASMGRGPDQTKLGGNSNTYGPPLAQSIAANAGRHPQSTEGIGM